MKLRNKKGFTIVELVIVIGVIGILSAILIPTFVNLTQKAQESALQSDLANSYSMYAAEAADEVIDNTFTRSGSDPEYVYTEVAVKFKDRIEIALKDEDGKFYHFDDDKAKWLSLDDQTGYALVVDTAETAFYSFNSSTSAYSLIADKDSAEDLSLYGKFVVYYNTAA